MPSTVAPTFEYIEEMCPCWEGHLYTVVAGQINIFDELIMTEKRMRGGWYELLDENAVVGDFIEFAVVDKDDTLGLFSMLGLTVGVDILELRKYVKNDPVNPLKHDREYFSSRSVFPVVAGLYLRSIYESTGSNDIKIKVVTLAYE